MTSIQSILMVRPSGFKTNIQTLENNFFQNISNLNENELLEKAQQEFDNLVNKIRSNGIPIIVFQDDQKHETPDSLFPNNWISFHKKNTIALYPMFAENRRLERSFELIKFIEKNGVIINSVNFPRIKLGKTAEHRLVIINKNEPGMIGKITDEIGYKNINIADMTHKSRDSIGINLIDLEDKPSQELIENIKNIDHVISVRLCSNL